MRLVIVLMGLLAGGALGQSPEGATDPEIPEMFDDSCLIKAEQALRDKGSIHDGGGRTQLVQLGPTDARQVLRDGRWRGVLPIQSFVNPPSHYSVIQFSGGSPPKARELCPLDQTYLVFQQGGFAPQPAIVYGPLK